MDKSWMKKPRNTTEYSIGLNQFLDFAFEKVAVGDTIRCPCEKCGFGKWQTREIVQEHLIIKPFPEDYVIWDLHGEKRVLEPTRNLEVMQGMSHPMDAMINDAFGLHRNEINADETSNERPREDRGDFLEFLKDGNEPLYEGIKCTKLEFIIKLYHIKVLCRISDKAITMILELLRDTFEEAKFPPSFYEAKKIISKLGLDYTKIDACPNDCMLYLDDDAKQETCKHCGTSRWNPKKKKKHAAKVICGK